MLLSHYTVTQLKQFKHHKRAYWSLWIISTLFIISLFAEILANDKPLILKVDGHYFLPLVTHYNESDIGLGTNLNINYKNPYIIEHIQTNGWMIMPIIPYSYNSIDFGLGRSAPSPPSLKHILGTDDQARDLLSRLIYGFRISLIFGLILTFASTILGVCAGAVQGYFGGWIDLIFQRFIEIWSGLPTLFIMIILSSILIPNFWWILGIVLLFQWTSLVGVVRAEFLKTRKQDYVTAARATGITHKRIIFQHILHNAMIATLTMLPFILNGSITTLTALDFLGFGLPPDEPYLGELLSKGKDNLFAPWIGISAFLVIGTILTLLIFIGEGVRDTLDPKYAKLRSEKDPS